MKTRLGQFNVSLTQTDGKGEKTEMKMSFAGYELEYGIGEFVAIITGQMDVLARLFKGFWKLMTMVRKDAPSWVETYNECANLIQEGVQKGEKKAE